MIAGVSWRLLLVCWSLVAGILWPATLRAQGQPEAVIPGSEAASRVEVNLVGAVGRNPEFVQLIEEWLAANEVTHVTRSVAMLALDDITHAQGSGPPVRIWVTVDPPQSLRMYVAEPHAKRYLVRDIPLPSGLDEIGRERSVQVILSSALAFMEHRVASTLREVERAFNERPPRPVQARPSARPPPPPLPVADAHTRRDRAGPGFGLGASYAASHQAEWSQGPGGVLLADFARGTYRLRPLLRGQYRWQQPITTARVQITERSVPLSASGALQWAFTPAFCWHLELGGGLGLVQLTPKKLPGSRVEPRARRWDYRPFGVAMLGAGWQTGHLQVELLGRFQLDLPKTHYAVQADSGVEREATPPRFQPGLVLDLVWLSHPTR